MIPMVEVKIVLVGAGSVMFGPSTMTDVYLSDKLDGATIMMHDIDKERLGIIFELMDAENDIKGNKITLERTTSRKEAFKDADFIINSITHGPRITHWWQDYKIPRKHGSRQIMGECGGPGGIFQAFRNILPIIDIVKDAEKICPDALFINYSNPLPYINLAIKRASEINCIGLCHQIAILNHHLPQIINMPIEDLKLTVVGLNHFGFLMGLENSKTGKDLMPEFNARALDHFKEKENKWEISTLSFEVYKRFKYWPHAGDNHMGEFLQFAHEYLEPQESYVEYGEQVGTGLHDKIMKKYKILKRGKIPRKGFLPQATPGERAIPIIEVIITDANAYESSVNYPNDGFITNLPQDLIVEGPAIVDKNGVHGIKYGALPSDIAAVLRIEASVQDVVVDAVLNQSRELAIAALAINPNVGSFEMAENIFNEMFELQRKYLPNFR